MSTPRTSGSPKANETPLVSICIPTYNVGRTVGETLESILAQRYANIVVHISDNASTDDTLKVVESFADPRITVHRQAVNQGAEANFTRCVELGAGKYTAIFHGDDVYEPDMVASQVEFLESHADIGAVFTRATMIDEHGVAFGVIGGHPGREHADDQVSRLNFDDLLKTMLLHHNFLVCPSAMVRTSVYQDKIMRWGSSLFKSASDVDTWLRLAREQDIAILGQALMRYRISAAQFSHINRNRTERADFFLVMDHYLNDPAVRALLTPGDLRHYQWLERHEKVARAFNLFGLGRAPEAKRLLRGSLGWDAIRAALSTRRGLVTLAGIALLRSLLPLGSSPKSAALVRAAKRISWR